MWYQKGHYQIRLAKKSVYFCERKIEGVRMQKFQIAQASTLVSFKMQSVLFYN